MTFWNITSLITAPILTVAIAAIGALALGGSASAQSACPGAGSCFEPHDGLGCDDPSCCQAVCNNDPFCCEVKWDTFCVNGANQLCTPPCPGKCDGDLNADFAVDGADLGLLLSNWGLAGCGDINLDGSIDGADLGLMLSAWGSCPPSCGSPIAGSCCSAHDGPFCDDASCCEAVCTSDFFCCEVVWDGICADEAIDLCESCFGCGTNSAGSCCEPHANPYCSDPTCCQTVCEVDSFCCSVSWDSICAGEAQELCFVCLTCGNAEAGSCFEVHTNPYCNDPFCCNFICGIDPFCCSNAWDAQCADAAAALCN